MTRVELIIVDLALLRRRDWNFLVIAGACFLKNGLKMVFLQSQGQYICSVTTGRVVGQ